MHRDKKIGFALGILLTGIVAAFFFRNEPDPFAELPPLDDPAGLDRQIAEKPITPYADPAEANAGSAQSQNPWELPGIYRANPEPQNISEGLLASPGAPDPINLSDPIPLIGSEASRQIAVGRPFGDLPSTSAINSQNPLPGNAGWTSVPTPPSADAPQPNLVKTAPTQAEGTPATPTMYKVQQGDTLSVLAEKHLGSSRRFMEIYEANRDKLKSPDDIKMGMQIRIPPRVKFTETLPGVNAAPNAVKPSENSTTILPPPEDSQWFSPFSRSPLSPIRRE